MRRKEKIVDEIIDALRITLGISVLLGFLVIIGAVMAVSTPTHTFTNDHYTVANSTDGENVIVTFEVTFEHRGEMSTADRKAAMDNMALAQSCANERLDEYIASHSAKEVRNGNLVEITVGCGNNDISIERVVTADALTRNA